MNKKRLYVNMLLSVVVLALMAFFTLKIQSRFIVQDALFLTALMFFLKFLFHVIEWTGFFDLFSYGYTRILASFKSHDKEAIEQCESYFEYKQNKVHVMRFEAAAIFIVYLALFLLARALG